MKKPVKTKPREIEDSLLKATEQKIEAGLTPQNRANYQRIVVAGMAAGLQGGANSLIAGLRQSQDPVKDCAVGAINIVMLLRRQSRNTMPAEAIPPAAMTLMLQALDFAERLGLVKITKEELVRATHIFTNRLMALVHVTPQKLTELAGKVNRVTQDPTQMEQLAQRSGVVKSSLASSPTRGLIDSPEAGRA